MHLSHGLRYRKHHHSLLQSGSQARITDSYAVWNAAGAHKHSTRDRGGRRGDYGRGPREGDGNVHRRGDGHGGRRDAESRTGARNARRQHAREAVGRRGGDPADCGAVSRFRALAGAICTVVVMVSTMVNEVHDVMVL